MVASIITADFIVSRLPYIWNCTLCKSNPITDNKDPQHPDKYDTGPSLTKITLGHTVGTLDIEPLKWQLDDVLTENQELRRVLEILTIDHEDMIAELNRNRAELSNMQEESRAKTNRLNELSQSLIGRPLLKTYRFERSARPT